MDDECGFFSRSVEVTLVWGCADLKDEIELYGSESPGDARCGAGRCCVWEASLPDLVWDTDVTRHGESTESSRSVSASSECCDSEMALSDGGDSGGERDAAAETGDGDVSAQRSSVEKRMLPKREKKDGAGEPDVCVCVCVYELCIICIQLSPTMYCAGQSVSHVCVSGYVCMVVCAMIQVFGG